MKPAKLSDLKPSSYNPRTITDEALSGLGTSLERFGDVSGIVVNSRTGKLVAGHQRVKALTLSHGDLPIKDGFIETPESERFRVRVVDWDETTEKAANVAANNHLIAGEFTEDLSDIIEELRDEIPDLCEDLRFDELEADLFEVPEEVPPVEETEPPEPPEDPVTKPGDLWLLGEHRVLCGDCTVQTDVDRVMKDESPKLLHTDLPYGISIVHVDGATDGGSKPFGSVQRGPKSKNQIIEANKYPIIKGDDKPFNPAHLLGIADVTVLWGGNYYADKLPVSSGWICWDKREGITRNSFADCELAWTSDGRVARVFSHLWNGLHKGSQHGQRRCHPTEKPVALFAWVAEQYTDEGDLIADWYAGSGPAVIAAEQLNRRCFAMEWEPKYCDVIVKRWQQLTGKDATLDGDGRKFEEIATG